MALRAVFRTFSSAASSKRLPPTEWAKLVSRVTNLSIDNAVTEITEGCGFALYNNIFTQKDLDDANLIIDAFATKELAKDVSKEEYTFGKDTGHDNIYNKQASQGVRMWNLLEKGEIFEKMVQPEVPMKIIDKVIGDDFCLGSSAVNYLQPGASAQKPHLDYPYWDYVNGQGSGSGAWPSRPKFNGAHRFFMNFQMLIMLDDFTEQNGATAVVPYSQREIEWPNEQQFNQDFNLVTGKRGTVLLFTGLIQHCSTSNASNKKRTSVLSQYLPKYVRPMEDMNQIGDAVRKRASPRMKQLLGEHTPYPKVFE